MNDYDKGYAQGYADAKQAMINLLDHDDKDEA
jgi:hypothetical protein